MATRTHRLCAALLAACGLASAAAAQCNPTVEVAHLFADDYWNFNGFGKALLWNAGGIFIGAPGADGNIGAVYAFEGELPALSQAKIRPSNLVDTWFFGSSVAVDGQWMAVGSSDFQAPGGSLGRVYVFKRHGGQWVEVAQLPSPGGAYDGFGTVALGGDTLLVGASADDDVAPSAGAVYVFELQSSQWVETAKLTASDVSKGFGGLLSLQGDRLLVGARGDSFVQGAVYVFERSGGVWSETAKITSVASTLNDNFGAAVGEAGDTVIIGASTDDDVGVNAGAAYIFRLQGAQWVQEAKLLPPAGGDQDRFGASVALSGERALIGAPGTDVDGTNDGAVFVFWDTGASSWLYGSPIDHPGWDHVEEDSFGQTLAVLGQEALIGLPNSPDSPPLFAAGSAMLFDVPLVGPSEVVRLGTPPNPPALLPGISGPPSAGSTWRPRIDHGAFLPGAVADLIGITGGPDNVATPLGTLLLDLAGAPPIVASMPPGETFAFTVPLACSVVGVTLSAQGASTDGGVMLLTNALDLRIGEP